MRRSRPAVAMLAALSGAALLPGSTAFAQERAPAASGNEAQLGEIVDVRTGGNEQAEASQKRIDDIADQTDELLGEYRTAWKQIESLDVYNAQMRELIGAQESEMASLDGQLERVQSVGRSVTPLMFRMIDAIEQFVALDLPFLIEERTQRVEELRRIMGRADITTAEKFRQIMEAYQIENEYGRTIEAYRSTIDIGGRETTVDFLRFGRIALVYQSLDESQSGAWSQESRSWVPLDDGEYRSAIRQGLRIARKQAAPDLIKLPLPAPSEGSAG
jgi:hypothetical protein